MVPFHLMRFILSALLLFFLTSISCFSQFSEKQKLVYRQIASLEFDSASVLLATDKDINAPHILLQNYLVAIKLLLHDNKDEFKKLKSRQDDYLQIINTLDDNDYITKWVRGELYLQWALIKGKFGEQVAATKDAYTAYQIFKDLEKEYPQNVLHKKNLGWMHMMASLLPRKIRWLAKMAGVTVNYSLGFEQLSKAAYTPNDVQGEALLFKEWTDVFVFKNQDTVSSELKRFIQSHPYHELAKLLEIVILKKGNHNELMLSAIEKTKLMKQPYLIYLKACGLMYKARYDEAIDAFKLFLEKYHYPHYSYDVFLKLAFIAHISGDNATRDKLIEKIASLPKPDFEQDIYAQNFAIKGVFPAKELLVARLYSDGGYMLKADSVCNTIELSQLSPSEKEEYYYRKGRIAEQLKKNSDAMEWYEKCINNHVEGNYFAPNACLFKGKLLAKTNKKEAKVYLKRVFKYKNYDYKESIETKAEKALDEL